MQKIYALFLKPLLLSASVAICGHYHSQVVTQTFSYTGSLQTFTVPFLCVNTITIEARGAGGGSVNTTCYAAGGLGARMSGVFTVTTGQVLNILVGQTGYSNGSDAGGGGGSFVTTTPTVPLIVAGGGGGASNYCGNSYNSSGVCNGNTGGVNASITTTATPSANGIVNGGSNGNGGNASGGSAGGGGGFFTNGASGAGNSNGYGRAFVNGAAGGIGYYTDHGGYGGGGCGWHIGGPGGGGGGYSGGGTSSSLPYCGGGGGGSYNAGTSQINTPGFQAGNGLVLISYQVPVVTSATSLSLCTGNSATLSVSGASTYTWNTGSNSTSIVVSPTSNTSYTVQGTNSLSCTGAAVINVSVNSTPPVLSVTTSTTQTCLGNSVVIQASGALSYSISNGVINGAPFFPTSTSTYTVSGQNGCGTTTAITTVTINPLPVTLSSSPSLICTAQSVTLTANATAMSYMWLPQNLNSNTVSAVTNPTSSSVYSVTAINGNCYGTATIAITVNPNPTITTASSTTQLCLGQTAALTAAGGVSYTWVPGNINAQTIAISPTTSTVYSVTGSNALGCTSTQSLTMVVNQLPTFSIVVNNPLVCPSGSAKLTAFGTSTYSWSTGASSASIMVNPTLSTTYSVTGTNSANQCSSTNTIQVDVFTPSVVVTGNRNVCYGSSTSLQAIGGTSYTWNPGNLAFSGVTLSPTVTTTYVLSSLSASANIVCPSTSVIIVTVNPIPFITTISSAGTVCPGEMVVVNASGASSYSWNVPGASGPSVAVTPTVSFMNMDIVVAGSNANGCVGTATVQLIVTACTGLDETKLPAAMNVFPNPNNGAFTIESDTNIELVITNSLGQTVKLIRLTNAINNRKTEVSGFSTGIYFISGKNSSGSFCKKIIVQN